MEERSAHWSARTRESALWRDAVGRLPLTVSGGAESGQFVWINPPRTDAQPDVLLEVEGLCVSGLPLYDVREVLENCGDPVRIKTTKAGGRLKKDLRYYLSLRFQKYSEDHRLQETIRNNLYRYSAPFHGEAEAVLLDQQQMWAGLDFVHGEL